MSDSDGVEGVDYAFPPIPSVAALKAAGKVFVCRYGGPGSASKQLTAGERDQLHAAGIAIVANAEGTAGGLKGGYDVGAAWARQADLHFRQLGLPNDRPIYLSVDFDAGSSDWSAIDAAMDGAASVIGRDRVGVYGGYKVIAHLSANGKARWYWQTYGWSGDRWHPKAHIQQYKNGVHIDGADCDLNRAMASDYGQWTGDNMTAVDLTPAAVEAVRKAIYNGDADIAPGSGGEQQAYRQWNTAATKATAAAEGVTKLLAQPPVQAAPIDQAAIDAAVEKALTKPENLAALAKAINDDAARRLAE